MNETYLTPKEIQIELKISKNKTYELINQCGFPKIRIGNRIRIPASEFEKYMKKQIKFT